MAFVEGQRAAEDDEHTEVGLRSISSPSVMVTNLIRLMVRMRNLARNQLLNPRKNSCEDLTRNPSDALLVRQHMNALIPAGNTLSSVLAWEKTLILR